jgi:hypothetical protein
MPVLIVIFVLARVLIVILVVFHGIEPDLDEAVLAMLGTAVPDAGVDLVAVDCRSGAGLGEECEAGTEGGQQGNCDQSVRTPDSHCFVHPRRHQETNSPLTVAGNP